MSPLLTLLSVLGLVPYVLFGLAALGPNDANAERMLDALVAWSAVVLAFAGGIHWGFLLRDTAAQPLWRRARVSLAALALIVAWVVVVLPRVAPAWLALLVLIIGYIAALLAEHQAGRRQLLPPRYLWLRWGFTVVATAMLITVLTLRLLGQTIVL
jgi:Protein of unknown function (DUF3429)